MIRRNGRGLRRLTRTAAHVDDIQPAWTPDGDDSRLITVPATGEGMPILLGAGTTPDW